MSDTGGVWTPWGADGLPNGLQNRPRPEGTIIPGGGTNPDVYVNAIAVRATLGKVRTGIGDIATDFEALSARFGELQWRGPFANEFAWRTTQRVTQTAQAIWALGDLWIDAVSDVAGRIIVAMGGGKQDFGRFDRMPNIASFELPSDESSAEIDPEQLRAVAQVVSQTGEKVATKWATATAPISEVQLKSPQWTELVPQFTADSTRFQDGIRKQMGAISNEITQQLELLESLGAEGLTELAEFDRMLDELYGGADENIFTKDGPTYRSDDTTDR